tara:strand:- start:2552 stop:2869 length:318 start_codon:yes stop_codon:yes gene_type:complete
MSDYLKFLSTQEYADKYGMYTPAVQCDCGNTCEGDEPKIYINECEMCEIGGTMSKKTIDKSWSIKHEGHLNKNNMIFTQEYYDLIKEIKKVNNAIRRTKWKKKQN